MGENMESGHGKELCLESPLVEPPPSPIHAAAIPWIQEGLHFQCTGCGQCCTGASGYVFLSPTDIRALAGHLSLSIKDFTRQYTRWVEGQLALLDRPASDHCIFLKDKKCSVYAARPVQCRTYPWWIHNLHSPEAWAAARESCEGIHPDAPLVPKETIEEECAHSLDNLLERNF